LGPSKFLGEKIIEMSDLNFISLRLPGVLSLDSSLVSRPWLKKIIYDIKKNKKIEIFNQNVKFNSIIDTIEIYNFIKFRCRNKKMIRGSYNFSASKPMKLKQIIKIITNFYSYNLKIKYRFINKSSSSLINIKKLDTKNNFKISSTKKILLRYLKNIG